MFAFIIGVVVRQLHAIVGWIEHHKDFWSSVQSIISSIAVVVGGLWAYLIFVRNRQKWPRADVAHRITHRALEDGMVLLRVEAVITNRGNVLIEGSRALTRVQQVYPIGPALLERLKHGEKPTPEGCADFEWPPLDQSELKWPKGHNEVEPGETETVEFDFVIGANIAIVQVYTHLWNAAKRRRGEIGWSCTSLYDLSLPERTHAARDYPEAQNALGRETMSPTDGKNREGGHERVVQPRDFMRQLHVKPEPKIVTEQKQKLMKPEPAPAPPPPVDQSEPPEQE